MAKRTIRVGFDFDGVIAYNPIRVFRRPAMWFIHNLLKKRDLEYPYPQHKFIRKIWGVLHETSFFPEYGFEELKTLLKDNTIEGYIITGRYAFVGKSLENWLEKHQAHDLFKKIYINDDNIQPHHFKEKILNELDLDYFVEDNWDIVNYLHNKFNTPEAKNNKIQIHWIYNILDKNKPYQYKHPHLKKFLDSIV